MSGKNGQRLSFIIIVLLLLILSLVGMIAPESAARLQGHGPLKWSVAILCGLTFSYILTWLLTAAPETIDPPSKSRGRYMQDIMITDIRRVLYYQPFLVLLIGWIMGWDVNRIVAVVSFLNLVTVCASFFRALRQWELREKEHKASLQA